ncbi:MAG: Wzz/FepE/Etk N-terminal domain-containing protein [Candidatus Latescibacterota bacterium]|nr:Wzz/FepE/Etk N-terminal domain-containing protein [Candidatus Latescibacterota bacterium]
MNTKSNDPNRVDLLDLIAALAAGRRLIIVGTIVVSLAAGTFSFLLSDEYEGLVQLLPPKEQRQGFGFADLLSELPIPSLRLGEKGTPADIYVAILKSPTLRRRMVNHFDLMSVYETDSMEEAIDGLDAVTEIGKSEQGTIMISVLDHDAKRAADLANQYVVFLDSTNLSLSQTAARNRFDFVSKLEAREDAKLKDHMTELQVFQEEHNAISLEDQARASIRAAADMQMAAMELVIKRLSLMQSGFSPNHPEVKRLQKEALMRQEALAFLRDGAEQQAAGARERGRLMDGLFLEENLFLPLREIPEVAQEYANIQKGVLVQSALMKLLLQQKAESLIEASNTTSTVQILDAAEPPEKPARPRRLLIVFVAAILSAFASVVYVLASTYVSVLRDRWNAEYATRMADG